VLVRKGHGPTSQAQDAVSPVQILTEIIRLVVMTYVKFPLSLRNVEDLLHERGIDLCHETVRFWGNRFGLMFAAEIRRKRAEAMRQHSHWRWHLDEVYVKINGEEHYLWRAVDHEGEVLESYVTKTRDKAAALHLRSGASERIFATHASCSGSPPGKRPTISGDESTPVKRSCARPDIGRWDDLSRTRCRELRRLREGVAKAVQPSALIELAFAGTRIHPAF
jgi:hypothetical protein